MGEVKGREKRRQGEVMKRERKGKDGEERSRSEERKNGKLIKGK